MDGAALDHARIEFDLAERVFVADNVLLQHTQQRFCLLWAEIDPLEIMNFDLRFGLLMKSAEGEEEVPNTDADLHAVGIAFAIGVGVDELDVGLSRVRHKEASVAGWAVGKKA